MVTTTQINFGGKHHVSTYQRYITKIFAGVQEDKNMALVRGNDNGADDTNES